MLDKLNAIEQKMKSPEVKVKIVKVGGAAASFIASVVVSSLIDKAINKGVDIIVARINGQSTIE